MQFSNNLLYSLKALVLPNQNRPMTQLEEKFPVPLAIRSSSRVEGTGHPFITFAKFSGFYTPSPSYFAFHATYQYFHSQYWEVFKPPSPLDANVINGSPLTWPYVPTDAMVVRAAADRPTKKDGLVDAVYLPSLFLVTFCCHLLLSPTESTGGHDDDEIHFLCRHRVLPWSQDNTTRAK